ncbi:hypothetical protein BDF14DRAFT_1839275 [Spinellus fusiger]|nr:hypothetical protein BDF14DRAFT_1839275 [Spinellus fusiger]
MAVLILLHCSIISFTAADTFISVVFFFFISSFTVFILSFKSMFKNMRSLFPKCNETPLKYTVFIFIAFYMAA